MASIKAFDIASFNAFLRSSLIMDEVASKKIGTNASHQSKTSTLLARRMTSIIVASDRYVNCILKSPFILCRILMRKSILFSSVIILSTPCVKIEIWGQMLLRRYKFLIKELFATTLHKSLCNFLFLFVRQIAFLTWSNLNPL